MKVSLNASRRSGRATHRPDNRHNRQPVGARLALLQVARYPSKCDNFRVRRDPENGRDGSTLADKSFPIGRVC